MAVSATAQLRAKTAPALPPWVGRPLPQPQARAHCIGLRWSSTSLPKQRLCGKTGRSASRRGVGRDEVARREISAAQTTAALGTTAGSTEYHVRSQLTAAMRLKQAQDRLFRALTRRSG